MRHNIRYRGLKRRGFIAGTIATMGIAVTELSDAQAASTSVNGALSGTSANPIAKAGQTVTRYTSTVNYRANIRSVPQLGVTTTIYATVPDKTKLVGSYDASGTWFHITSGTYSGRYIASSLLQVQTTTTSINGNVNPATLVALPASFIKSDYQPTVLRCVSTSAAVGLTAMNLEFTKKFGTTMTIEEGYRTIATQRLYYQMLGYPRAAIPGTSNHGFGNALDLGVAKRDGWLSPYSYGNAYDVWMTQNGRRFGWDRPDFMDQYGSNPEFWHYNFVG